MYMFFYQRYYSKNFTLIPDKYKSKINKLIDEKRSFSACIIGQVFEIQKMKIFGAQVPDLPA